MDVEREVLYHLGVALSIGLLVGVERGWKGRGRAEGGRVAGLRTYGLIGLFGGISALLGARYGGLALGLAFVALMGTLVAGYFANLRRGDADVSITGLVASLLTFALGALAASGRVAEAGAAAVVMTMLLAYKPALHRWVSSLEAGELDAGVKLLLISVVLLPVLPDRGYGPYQALNPYAIWWMVVLVATISFVGYFAVKIGGARRGVLFTGLFAGLVSSTALALHFARLSRENPALNRVLAVGILFACGTMFPRVLLVATLLEPALLAPLAAPMLIMALLVYVPAIAYWRMPNGEEGEPSASPLKNPLELRSALGFGALLALVLLLGKALRDAFGDAGVLALAAASGVADADAITLSLARMSGDDLTHPVAASGIVLAAAVNSLSKAGLVFAIGGRAIGLRVGLPLFAGVVAGLATAWLTLV